jgi:surface protein
MFKNCTNLKYVNLSNFQTYNYKGIFTGANNIILNINKDFDNTSISKDISELINNNLKEIIVVECQIGEGSKCKGCIEGWESEYCGDCNEGYYLPYNKKRMECIKCQDKCLECFGLVIKSYCRKCEEGYELTNGKCKKECTTGENEKCKTCDLINTDLCGSCNEGYYLPEEDKTKCKKCSMDCCKECPNDKCIICSGDDVNYPELTLEEALKKVMDENLTPESFSKKIYYSNFYPSVPGIKVISPSGNYYVNGKKHFVFHTYKRKMIELNGLYHILSNYNDLVVCNDNENKNCNEILGSEYNNEYFQSVRQGYDFTCIDHIYQKNDKKYKYNDKTLNFDEVAADELTAKT